MAAVFQKATKRQGHLRLALEGPAGYGKTYTALEVATRLAPGKVAFLDTEAGSASKYADLFDFDVIEMDPPFHPKRAVEAMKAAEANGYGAVVLDSLSHFWAGDGGLLSLVDEIARTKYHNDSHRAWKDAGEIQQELVDAVLRSKLHVIAAMRTKKDYVREEVEKNGRMQTKIRAAGTKTIQRDEFDYEFDIVGRFDVPAVLAIVKSRCAELPPETVVEKPGAQLVEVLQRWLSSGESFEDQEAAAAEAAVRQAQERQALEEQLLELATEYRGLVPDFATDVAALVEKKRGTATFDQWLARQVEVMASNVEEKRAELEGAAA